MNTIQPDFQASEFNMRTLFDVWYDTAEEVIKKVYIIRGFRVYETDGKITKVEKI